MSQPKKAENQTHPNDGSPSPSSATPTKPEDGLPPFDYTDIKPDTIVRGILSREDLEKPKK